MNRDKVSNRNLRSATFTPEFYTQAVATLAPQNPFGIPTNKKTTLPF